VLEVKNVFVKYGEIEVVRDVSLEVNEGEIVSIVGANGAGKSTLLRAICGLVHPSSGKVIFNGEDLSRTAPYKIVDKGIAYVPEGRRLFPLMTVKENLEMGAYISRARKNMETTMRDLFQLFPILEERSSQVAGTLSGGQQQMVTIGRGLMSQPKIIMLDEPSLGIAPNLVQEIFAKIAEVRKKGMTILLVEQNLQQALNIADRGYVLENGRIALSGTGRELLENEHVRSAYLGI